MTCTSTIISIINIVEVQQALHAVNDESDCEQEDLSPAEDVVETDDMYM
jgi:hypothetical protein